jgi:hypothetical protein
MDETRSTAAVSVRLELGSTVTDADAAATALASVVLPVTGCVLVRQRVVYKFVAETPEAAAAGSTIKRSGVFIFDCVDDEHQALIEIPGILDSVLVVTEPGVGVLIDTSNADVAAVIEELVAEGVCDPFGNEIASLAAAYRQSRV